MLPNTKKTDKMNRLLLIFVILQAGCVSHQEAPTETTITGKITGKIPDRIEYTLPINGVSYFGFENSVQPDSLGDFEITLAVDSACFIEFSNGYDAFGTVIAEPGMNYTLLIDTENTENKFNIECENKAGQQLYNQNTNRSMITGHFEEESRKYRNDSILSEIKQSIKQSEESEMAEYRELLNAKVISADFYKLVSTDRSYFYAGAQTSIAFINYLLSERAQNILDEQEYTNLWNDALQSYPISNPDLMRSPWFFYYIQSYLRYKELIEDNTDVNTLSEIRKQGLIHTHNINLAEKYLTGKQLEYYCAAYIYYEAVNKNYEEELIALFEQFKKDYPASGYTPFIESEIIPIVTFHKKQNETLNEGIHILDNAENINSLKEAVKGLKANRVYVDVWASWCGPCKKEFQHNEKLYELLKNKEVTMLYLSVDKEERKETWLEMIKYYELEGYHIRVNDKLRNDLLNLRGNDAFGIPWHILTDGDGNIIIKYASSPSDIQNLEKQLNKD
jgi:thiol-disulfide isomerase/thioredoxin